MKDLQLRDCHKDVLNKTPFWGIFEAIVENRLTNAQCRKSDKMIIEIIETYDPTNDKFRLGKTYLEALRHGQDFRYIATITEFLSPFKVVILIGSSSSAVDICRDLSGAAKEVHIASRSITDGTIEKLPGYDNIWLCSMIENARGDGTVVFRDGSAVCADVILHCTGYKYHFPFLDMNGNVTVDDNRVGPLYKHIFPPLLAPSLSFVGLPWRRVLPLPLCEIQCKWIACVLSGRVLLPSSDEMVADVEAFYRTLDASGIPKHYTHNIGDALCTAGEPENTAYSKFYALNSVCSIFEYMDWLASECACPPLEEWRKQMYAATRRNRMLRSETYRDEWDDQHLVALAHEDFAESSLNKRLVQKV
ncbi:hypothetical protein Vadar_023060 [Vaccinium darrowii]|uniref:Uncharacterized protein n=1 Tax=Vaccinium darrowii TaxID=229202 RepID=A0ACB7X3I0_9ERIC|nr:hypothetical protein Vadar_023060 [Vaccinium darrowii]